MSNKLVVFIIGTTGSGKTKLSLNLSSNDGYEIISCDSMQIYKDADIMTAKATSKEQLAKPHHGINLLDLGQQGFNRNDFVQYCKKTVDEIQSRNNIPVIVGGTTYYMEPLLFKSSETNNQQNIDIEVEDGSFFEHLKQIDPIAAQKFHANDIRRIKNALKFNKLTGMLASQIPDFHSLEASIEMDNFVILWPQWRLKENLNDKLKTRIHSMIHDEGGLQEIIKIFDLLQAKEIQNGGVLQSIGYRQFSKVYDYVKESKNELNEVKQDLIFVKLLNEGEEQLLKDTINYTKKQLQWIKNRIICNPNIDVIKEKLFILSFDSEEQFNQSVINPAQKIFSAFIDGTFNRDQFKQYMLKDEQIQEYKKISHEKQRDNWNKQLCFSCKKEVNGPLEWKQHIQSKQHKFSVNKLKKQEQKQIQKEQQQQNQFQQEEVGAEKNPIE